MLLTVNMQKQAGVCPEKSPYVICIANVNCAYIRRTGEMSFLDYLPFLSGNNRCVHRKYFPEGLLRLADSAWEKLSWMFDKVNTKESELNIKQRKRILGNFTYEFDQDVFWGITRYEIGFYLILAILGMLHFNLKTMGNKKSYFDFCRDDEGQRVN